jgi:hypothetical protein
MTYDDLEGSTQGSNPENRFGPDRRVSPTSPLDAFRYGGRRSRVRRQVEREVSYFVDRFDPLTLAIVVAILCLCLVDGILTIELLDARCVEINPFMGYLLDMGHREFLVGKYVLTALGLPLLVLYKNWKLFGTRFRAGYLLPIVLVLYVMLIIYQIQLFQHVESERRLALESTVPQIAAETADAPGNLP